MEEEQAVTKLRADPNDRAAWEIMYLWLRPKMLVYVSRLLIDFGLKGEEATDIVQSVILSFLQQWETVRHTIPNAGAALAYLKRSARNLLITQLRIGRRAEALQRFLTLRVSDEVSCENELRRIVLRQVIDQLSPQCAALLKRYIEEDLTPAELADEENVPPKTFYSRWYRCLKRAAEIAGPERSTSAPPAP